MGTSGAEIGAAFGGNKVNIREWIFPWSLLTRLIPFFLSY